MKIINRFFIPILGLISVSPLSLANVISLSDLANQTITPSTTPSNERMVTDEDAMNAQWDNICNGAGDPQGSLLDQCRSISPPDQSLPPNSGPGVGSNTGTSTGLANSAHLSDSQHKKAITDRITQLKNESTASSSIIERLGFFINGKTTQTNQIDTPFENGSDSSLGGFIIGVDYFFTDKFLAGFAVGYSNTDIDFIGGSHTELDSVSTLFYANYALTNDLSIDGYAGWTGGEFDIRRNFSYPESCVCDANVAMTATSASATTHSDKALAGIGIAYNINIDALAITPRARFQYTETFIDGYAEQGGDGLALRYQDQNITTLQTEAGVDASYAFSFSWGALLPRVGVSYVHEFSNDSRLIHTSFVLDASNIDMAFNTNNPERDYMLTAFGVSAVLPHGIQLFIDYERVDLHRYFDESYTVTGGFRVGL